jgi:hypothetical protein
MRAVKSIAEFIRSKPSRSAGTTVAAAPQKQSVVMGRASDLTQGRGWGLELLMYPRGA